MRTAVNSSFKKFQILEMELYSLLLDFSRVAKNPGQQKTPDKNLSKTEAQFTLPLYNILLLVLRSRQMKSHFTPCSSQVSRCVEDVFRESLFFTFYMRFLSSASLPNISTSSPIGMSQRALQYIKSECSGSHDLVDKVCSPIFLTECPELCLLVQPSFSPLLCAGFKICCVQ